MNGPLSPIAAQAERLEPRHRDATRTRRRAAPSARRRACSSVRSHSCLPASRFGHRRQVVELVPRRPAVDARADGLDAQRRVAQVLGPVAPGHDHRGRAVARDVAVVEAERRRDHARRDVVVHRHRVAVDRVRVQLGVAARVQRDPRELLARRAVLVEVALGEHRDPDRGRRRGEHEVPLHEPRRLEAAAATPAAGHHRGAALVALRRALVDGAEAQHVVREARTRPRGTRSRPSRAGPTSRARCRTNRSSGAARPSRRTRPRR